MKIIKIIILLFLLLISNLFANNSLELIEDFVPTNEEIKDGAVIIQKSSKYTLDDKAPIFFNKSV